MNIKSAFIRKRKENYNVIIEYLDENSNKYKQRSQGSYKDKKQAEVHLIEIKNSINKNKVVISKNVTLVERCCAYVYENEDTWSHYTVTNRLSWIKNHYEPYWKDTLLKDVTVSKLQKFVNIIFKKFKPEGSRVRYRFLRSVLAECYRLREIPENPCDFIKLPKIKDTFKADVYTKEEVKILLDALGGSTIEIPILLMLLLGLRFGEACGLRWSDIDFDNDVININQILTYKRNCGFEFKDPKTESSKRSLHAPDELMQKLKSLRNEQNKLKIAGLLKNEHNLVCLNKRLSPWFNSNLTDAYKKLLNENNLKDIRLHDLRHTNATMMILSGTHMKTVSNRLGHSDIKISMNRYTHLLDEMDKEASANLSQILFNDKSV
ncbi:MAG: tyrosine-type recombinase/integrase [Romboutsia sp.]|uniref:tyrosine-type recombinase/integrase n=1 Tax=Romboutsia sp. TaxID=1965302 RepID=UPI003F3C77FF